MSSIEIAFRLIGDPIYSDSQYLLYSGLTNFFDGHLPSSIQIDTSYSNLKFRTPIDYIPQLISLTGKSLQVGTSKIRIGTADVRPLIPSERLRSRLVILKGRFASDEFVSECQKKLERSGYKTGRVILSRRGGGSRTIKDRRLMGFGIDVVDLNQEDAARLMSEGLGRLRHMGCGIFYNA